MSDTSLQLEALQKVVDKHERMLYGDGSDPGLYTQLLLIRQDLEQLKWGVRIILIAGTGWLVTRLLGVMV